MNNEGFIKKATELLEKLSIEEKLPLICTHQLPSEKTGFGEFWLGTEIARGFVSRDEDKYSTVFPQPIGLAGTFDTELMTELGRIAGNEARAYYNSDKTISPCLWGPTVDMERHPLWGRTEEGYGEDVCLAGEMTRAYTEALADEKDGFIKTIPTLKHFCANNNEKERGSSCSYMPLRLKYEYYYAAFGNAIKHGGAKSVMAAYNEINGIPGLCDPDLENILKNEWGLWFTVTDGGDFSQNLTLHRCCDSHAETIADALKAGCDVMTDNEAVVCEAARQALEQGLITEEDIDRAALRVITARLRLGELAENCPYNDISLDVLDDNHSEEMCLRAAKEQITLLKNNGILPLKAAPKRIAVVGALADDNLRDWYTGYFRDAVSVSVGIKREFPESEVITDRLWDVVAVKAPNGKYLSAHEDCVIIADADSISGSELFELRSPGGKNKGWDNLYSVKYGKFAEYRDNTLKLGRSSIYNWFTGETFDIKEVGNSVVIEEYMNHRKLCCDDGGKLSFKPHLPVLPENSFVIEMQSSGRERGLALAENADIVVYCMGNDPIQCAKECYDRDSLEWTSSQIGAAELFRYNKNIISVIVSSYPYAVCREDEILPAMLYTTHAGAHLGTAVAETLSGKNNPAGRLAMTWYRSDADLPDIMAYDIEKYGLTYMYFKGTPLYPFGYGLSYSRYSYKSMDISAAPDGSLTARVTVENISDTDGDEVIQLYFAVDDSAVTRPVKKLCAFSRVRIAAHSEITAELRVNEDILQIYDVRRGKMITESGKYRFMAGGSSADLPLSAEITLGGEKPGKRSSSFESCTFDSCNDLRISWSNRLKKHFVTPERWCGTAVYCGNDLSDKSRLKLYISSINSDSSVDIYIGKNCYSCPVSATISHDDHREYIIPIESTSDDLIVIVLHDGMGLFDIEVG